MRVPMYPAPGGASKVDGFNIDFSGDAEFQAMLLRMYPSIVKRAIGICRTLGEDLAAQANQAAPVGKAQKGRPGGRLSRSFGVKERPIWLKYGKAGVAVRSSTKYHHYQEFGVDKKDVRVIKFRTAQGKKVRRGAIPGGQLEAPPACAGLRSRHQDPGQSLLR